MVSPNQIIIIIIIIKLNIKTGVIGLLCIVQVSNQLNWLGQIFFVQPTTDLFCTDRPFLCQMTSFVPTDLFCGAKKPAGVVTDLFCAAYKTELKVINLLIGFKRTLTMITLMLWIFNQEFQLCPQFPSWTSEQFLQSLSSDHSSAGATNTFAPTSHRVLLKLSDYSIFRRVETTRAPVVRRLQSSVGHSRGSRCGEEGTGWRRKEKTYGIQETSFSFCHQQSIREALAT